LFSDFSRNRVLTDGEIHADGRHGLEDMKIIRAIHEAAESGDVVEL
jgi:xylose dehydrogenase (NAD/NADP)